MDAVITEKCAIYHDDCLEVMPKLPDGKIHFSIYSPPFSGPGVLALYHYSSSPRDLSNSRSYDEFMEHYRFVVREIHRLTMPGRLTCVHCMDVPSGNTGHGDHLHDFPGDIIRMHEDIGFDYVGRVHIWKEPLGVRNRTMRKDLAHATVVDDATLCGIAGADYLLILRKRGENPVPVVHEHGLLEYYGSDPLPSDAMHYRGWQGNQIENKYSQNVWRRYASSNWYDVRIDNVLPFVESKDEDDEKHVHPLQLDVIMRAIQLWTNEGEVVFTPFMGVGSEVYGAVRLGRVGMGVELKASYFKQAARNLERIEQDELSTQTLFDFADEEA